MGILQITTFTSTQYENDRSLHIFNNNITKKMLKKGTNYNVSNKLFANSVIAPNQHELNVKMLLLHSACAV